MPAPERNDLVGPMQWNTWLLVLRARVECQRCGPTVGAVPWLDTYARMSTRLAEKIARLAQMLPITHVAQCFRVSRDTVQQIDQRALQRRLGRLEDHLDGLTQLAVDEFVIETEHRSVTIVLDLQPKRVVRLVWGRGDDALASLFTAPGPARCAQGGCLWALRFRSGSVRLLGAGQTERPTRHRHSRVPRYFVSSRLFRRLCRQGCRR